MKRNQTTKVSFVGLASAACRNIGCDRSVYGTAVRKKEKGEQLTLKELDVLVEYNRLVEETLEKAKTV